MRQLHFFDRYHYSFLTAVFLIAFAIGYSMIEYDAQSRIKAHMVQQLESSNIQYKIIYNLYKKNSRMVFSQIVNRPEILKIFSDLNATNIDEQRKKLYQLVVPKYKFAKKMGVGQLHFHLPNNSSFLRMHKPEQFGDDLSDVRYSVAYVNTKHKPVLGFEQGRIIHGFRFVYPLKSSEGVHLGSVEVSINSDAFVETFKNTIFIDAYLILDAAISRRKLFANNFKNYYVPSLESEEYLITKKSTELFQDKLTRYLHQHRYEYRADIKERLKSKKAFAHIIKTSDDYYAKVFIPISNIKDKKVVAYFITSKKSDILKGLYQDALYIKLGMTFLLLLIIYVIHKNLRYSSTLRSEIEYQSSALRASQKKIVESEKMASLGTLVAGVAHEINTPIGLGVTAMSHFLEETKSLKMRYDNELMSQDEFEHYINDSVKTAEIVFANLVRSAELIKSFKQISIDQSVDALRDINVKEYLNEILLSLHNRTKKHSIEIITEIEDNLHVKTYAGAWSQIFTNLVLNSVIHAFESTKKPKIIIAIKKNYDKILIDYQDNGSGMSQEQLKQVFDPFYTTKRGSGGSGLGMHIVYNLVTQKLGGSISVESQEDDGVHFIISFYVQE
jgi:signal transduction histidine kinase